MEILIKNIRKEYKVKRDIIVPIDNLNLEINSGDFLGICGASGAGKSTLLLTIGGLLKPDAGDVIIDKTNIYNLNNKSLLEFRAKNIGFVFQEFYLIPYLSVLDNIMLPSTSKTTKDKRIRAENLAEQFHLTARIKHTPSMLSVGEQQRVAMARALFLDPMLILADEPTGNLDRENSKVLLDCLLSLSKSGRIVVMATHDDFALSFATRKIELDSS